MACVLGYLNRIDAATLSGGSWAVAYPLSNLKNRYLARKARSTNAVVGSTVVDIDLTEARSIGVVALVAHNFSNASTVRIQGSSAANQSVSLYDSGALSVPSGTDYGLSFTNVSARYWRLSIADTANTAGYVEFGRVFIGTAFKPANTINFGPTLAVESKTGVVESLGGMEYFDRRANRRVFQAQFDWMNKSESYGEFLGVQRSSDVSGEIYLIADDEDTVYPGIRNFLGRLRTLSPIAFPYVGVFTTAIEIAESI